MAVVDEGVPEQQTTLVAQLEAERANAEAYGNDTSRIDKQLKELGVKKKAAEKRAEAAPEKKAEPTGRHMPQARHTASGES